MSKSVSRDRKSSRGRVVGSRDLRVGDLVTGDPLTIFDRATWRTTDVVYSPECCLVVERFDVSVSGEDDWWTVLTPRGKIGHVIERFMVKLT